jgi:hypothetical protein
VIDPADMDSLERALNENDVSLPSLSFILQNNMILKKLAFLLPQVLEQALPELKFSSYILIKWFYWNNFRRQGHVQL